MALFPCPNTIALPKNEESLPFAWAGVQASRSKRRTSRLHGRLARPPAGAAGEKISSLFSAIIAIAYASTIIAAEIILYLLSYKLALEGSHSCPRLRALLAELLNYLARCVADSRTRTLAIVTGMFLPLTMIPLASNCVLKKGRSSG